MSNKYDNIVYQAEIIFCNWLKVRADNNPQTINSINRIKQYRMRVTVIKGDRSYVREDSINHILNTTKCVPVRIFDEDTAFDDSVDWCYQSPISEIHFDCIPRWWPESWLYTDDGEIPDKIIINIGTIKRMMIPEIEISCNVSNKQNDNNVQCISFCEIHVNEETDEEEKPVMVKSSEEQRPEEPKQEVPSNGLEEEDMFGKKAKDKKVTEEKVDVIENTSESNTTLVEETPEESIMSDVVETKESILTAEPAKSESVKRIDAKSFGLGMGAGILAVGAGVGVYVLGNHFGWWNGSAAKESKTPSNK